MQTHRQDRYVHAGNDEEMNRAGDQVASRLFIGQARAIA